jgi:hypothetical protein
VILVITQEDEASLVFGEFPKAIVEGLGAVREGIRDSVDFGGDGLEESGLGRVKGLAFRAATVVEDLVKSDLAGPREELGPGLVVRELFPHRQLAALEDVLGVEPVGHEGMNVGGEGPFVPVEEHEVMLGGIRWFGRGNEGGILHVDGLRSRF